MPLSGGGVHPIAYEEEGASFDIIDTALARAKLMDAWPKKKVPDLRDLGDAAEKPAVRGWGAR